MTDLSKTIAPKSDQLNADDLIGGPITITITRVVGCEGDQPIAIHYDGDGGKPFKPCKTIRRLLVLNWGNDGNAYAGRGLTLYRDPKVKFGGIEVGGIRISHMSHISEEKTFALSASKAKFQAHTVKPLQAPTPKPPAQDRVADGVRALKDRIAAAADGDTPGAIELDPDVVKQRAWLAANRADLAKEIDDAIAARNAAFDVPAGPAAVEPPPADAAVPPQQAEDAAASAPQPGLGDPF